jgi:transposase-like protein
MPKLPADFTSQRQFVIAFLYQLISYAMSRRYTQEEKERALAKLAGNGGNIFATAKQLKIPQKTLEYWNLHRTKKKKKIPSEKPKKSLVERLEDEIHRLLDAVPEKIQPANLSQVFVAIGISIEKMQLLKGILTPEEMIGRISDGPRRDAVCRLLGLRLSEGGFGAGGQAGPVPPIPARPARLQPGGAESPVVGEAKGDSAAAT